MKRVYAQVCLVNDDNDESVEGAIHKKLKELGFKSIGGEDGAGEYIQGEMDIMDDVQFHSIPSSLMIEVKLECQVEDVDEDELK